MRDLDAGLWPHGWVRRDARRPRARMHHCRRSPDPSCSRDDNPPPHGCEEKQASYENELWRRNKRLADKTQCPLAAPCETTPTSTPQEGRSCLYAVSTPATSARIDPRLWPAVNNGSCLGRHRTTTDASGDRRMARSYRWGPGAVGKNTPNNYGKNALGRQWTSSYGGMCRKHASCQGCRASHARLGMFVPRERRSNPGARVTRRPTPTIAGARRADRSQQGAPMAAHARRACPSG